MQNTGEGGTTINPGTMSVQVDATTGPLQVDGGQTTQVNVTPSANIQGLITVVDSNPMNPAPVSVNDSSDTSPRTVSFGTSSDGNFGITGLTPATIEGTPGGVNFSVTSGSGGTSYQVKNVPTAIVTITGDGTTDTLQGTTAGPNTWQFTGPASGILDGTVDYTHIPNPSVVAVAVSPGNQNNNNGKRSACRSRLPEATANP